MQWEPDISRRLGPMVQCKSVVAAIVADERQAKLPRYIVTRGAGQHLRQRMNPRIISSTVELTVEAI